MAIIVGGTAAITLGAILLFIALQPPAPPQPLQPVPAAIVSGQSTRSKTVKPVFVIDRPREEQMQTTPRPEGPLRVFASLPSPEGGVWMTTETGEFQYWMPKQPESKTENYGPAYGLETCTSNGVSVKSVYYGLGDGRVRRVNPVGLLDDIAIHEKRVFLKKNYDLVAEQRWKLADLEAIELLFRNNDKPIDYGPHAGEPRYLRLVFAASGWRRYGFLIIGFESEVNGELANTIIGSFRRKGPAGIRPLPTSPPGTP